jgi:mycothiol system anti-sigma-R factor
MNCQETIARLSTFLDRELSEAEVREVQVHLKRCPPCVDLFHFEEGVKRLVKRCCEGERAPAAFRERLDRALRAQG